MEASSTRMDGGYPPEAMTEALLKWMGTFSSSSSSSSSSKALLRLLGSSDGVEMAKVLGRIDPEYFGATERIKLKEDVPADNKRLKANNLKKVLAAIDEYNADVLGIGYDYDQRYFAAPDPAKAAEGDPYHIGRMVQLMLGCAVNCDNKQKHIGTIMNMEESVQQLIMQAIQELIDHQVGTGTDQSISAATSAVPATSGQGVPGGGGSGGNGAAGSSVLMSSLPITQAEIRKMATDLEEANMEREVLKQRCHELENQVTLLQDEKSNISADYEQLQSQQAGKIGGVAGGPSSSLITKDDLNFRQKEMKRQLEIAQDDLYRIEKERDEMLAKMEELEKQLEESRAKELELQKTAEYARALKDELDILRETSDKVVKYEATIESYKKKMEEVGDVKRQLKLLEDKNTALVQNNLDLEESVRKSGNWKPQMDSYKKQIAELHSKLEDEMGRGDKLEFETKRLHEKVGTLSVERDRLQKERNDLREANGELQDQVKLGGVTAGGVGSGGPAGHSTPGGVAANANESDDDDDVVGLLEMIPPSVKERLLRLRRENKKLKAAMGGGTSGVAGVDGGPVVSVLRDMLEDSKEREKRLESKSRKMSQRILELEAGLEEAIAAGKPLAAGKVPAGAREELELKLSEANKTVSSLQEVLHKKEVEMQGMEERYKKYIEKAKSVIKTLDPKQNPNAAPEMSALRSQLSEKDRLIETLEQEADRTRAIKEMEEHLLTSAFYNLSMQVHRSTVENRLSNVHSSPTSQMGQSFLARQRQTPIMMAAAPASVPSRQSMVHQGPSSSSSSQNYINY